MDIDSICYTLARSKLDSYLRALVFLEATRRNFPDREATVAWVVRELSDHNVANLNNSRLKERFESDPRVKVSKNNIRIKDAAGDEIAALCPDLFDPPKPTVNHSIGYLPEEMWKGTRGYIESVCKEINGCCAFGFYNAASILIRRLIETLIIEAFTASGKAADIKDADGNFRMLSGLINACNVSLDVQLGRESKRALGLVKELGDRSAHNPRFLAVEGDVRKIEGAVRVLAEELLVLAKIR